MICTLLNYKHTVYDLYSIYININNLCYPFIVCGEVQETFSFKERKCDNNNLDKNAQSFFFNQLKKKQFNTRILQNIQKQSGAYDAGLAVYAQSIRFHWLRAH